MFCRTNVHFWIEQPGRPDDLLDDHPARLLDFPITGRRAHVNDLTDTLLPFGKLQRSIVERAG